MSLAAELKRQKVAYLRQRRELVELIGFETRNKYSIETEDGKQIGFAAEQQKGLLGVLFRQALGHWRSFELLLFNAERQAVVRAHHPFRFFFQRLDVSTIEGRKLGAVQRRFAIFSKKFDVEDPHGTVTFTVRSPLWHIWTFSFQRNGVEHAAIRKKWGGFIKEAFIDADSFAVEFSSEDLTEDERLLLVSAGLFVDLIYFERKGSGGIVRIGDFIPD